MFTLANKIAVITGAGSGIGQAIAKLFAQQGAWVHLPELQLHAAQQTLDSIVANAGKGTVYACDITNTDQVAAVMNEIGVFDILVNCAGIAHVGTATSTSVQDFERVFQVNVKGTYHCLHYGIPQMQKRGGGVILNVASIAALTGIPDRFAYSMSKGAVHAMTMSVAKDYIKDNIRCNSVSPGRVHTPFVDGFLKKNYPGQEAEMFEKLSKTQPIGRMGLPIEVAHQVLYLCSEEAAFITGSDFSIDGGFITLNS